MAARQALGRMYWGNLARRQCVPLPTWVMIFASFFFVLNGTIVAEESRTKNVLVLYGAPRDLFAPVSSLESKLRARVESPVDFYVEYLNIDRLENKEYERSVIETLQDTYSARPLDLVMAASYPALQFALRHRSELSPGVPIVFFEIDLRRVAGQKWPGVTGATAKWDLQATIELALRLHPNINTFTTIATDSSRDSNYWRSVIHAELLRNHRNVRQVDLDGIPANQLFEKLDGLGQQTIVLFGMDPRDSIDPSVGALDVLARVSQRLPTYCAIPANECLSHGGIGGAFYDTEEQASLAAQLASRVLSGERPENIPVVNGSPSKIYVNWQELQRWHIPLSSLPAGSVILYREQTVWERDRKYIIPAILLIVGQSLLIVGLFWHRARKRKAEAVLRESEERFRLMADSTPSLVWMCDPHGKVTYLNERRIVFTGPDPKAGYGDTWITYIHPEDVKNVLDTLWQALKDCRAFSKEYRLRRSDGVYRWMFDVASPRMNGDGSFAGFIGSAIDVTDQKLAQQALQDVSGQLIEAQEKERSRIARDLHDDICQRLALLSMELDRADGSRDGSSGTTKENLEKIRKHCSEIADDVQSLSHQLHSSKLELLGIAAAIKGFCKEFSKRHEVNIEFTNRDVPQYLPKDISLCLFRVTQEALQNAVKYSGTSNFTVQIHATADEVQLAVSDSGAGFDVKEAKMNQGLGLVSMQERVHLVHGKLLIESEPGKGTKILAVVPTVTDAFEDRTSRQAERVKEIA